MRKLINVLENQQYRIADVEFQYAPVMSKDTFDLHYGKLYKNYVKKASSGDDSEFILGGVKLHDLYFTGIQPPKSNNKPHGESLRLITEEFGSYTDFKSAFTEVCLSTQGSMWVYLSKNGQIKTIQNHKPVKDVALIIDMWEHAYICDYGADKQNYVNNYWKIIDWEVVNIRLG